MQPEPDGRNKGNNVAQYYGKRTRQFKPCSYYRIKRFHLGERCRELAFTTYTGRKLPSVIFSGVLVLLPEPALAQGVIALDEQLDAYWIVEKKVAPKYPTRALYAEITGCSAVGFIIEPDGSTSNHKVLAFYPSKSKVFGKSAIAAAKQFIYQPSERNPDKTSALTINVFMYEISGGRQSNSNKRENLHETCLTAAKKVLEAEAGGTDAG